MERLFDFMKNHVLQLASDVPDHLTCTICKKVLVDSHIATNCGCKFCLKCITDYLLDGCKQCPSGKEECSGVILDLSIDMAKDVSSNVLISNLLICCPHENCGHQCRLREMPDHVLLCTNRPVECEFSFVGCEERLAVEDDMANHLATKNVGHMRLLMGHLRQMVFRLDEAGELNERNAEWQTEKNELLRSIREMKEEMNEVKAVEQHTANEMQRIILKNEELENKMLCQKRKMEEMEAKMNENIENVTKKLREEIEKKVEEVVEDRIEELREEITDEIERNQDEQTKKMQQIQEMAQWGEFVWTVEKMSEKRQEASDGKNEYLFSEYFFSHRNGYRMRLKMYPNRIGDGKGTHLSLFFQICKGPFDDVLKWPMNKKIRMAFINQTTGDEEFGCDYSYEKCKDKCAESYQKPTKENTPLGCFTFISWDELPKNNGILSNDVLVIKCIFAD